MSTEKTSLYINHREQRGDTVILDVWHDGGPGGPACTIEVPASFEHVIMERLQPQPLPADSGPSDCAWCGPGHPAVATGPYLHRDGKTIEDILLCTDCARPPDAVGGEK